VSLTLKQAEKRTGKSLHDTYLPVCPLERSDHWLVQKLLVSLGDEQIAGGVEYEKQPDVLSVTFHTTCIRGPLLSKLKQLLGVPPLSVSPFFGLMTFKAAPKAATSNFRDVSLCIRFRSPLSLGRDVLWPQLSDEFSKENFWQLQARHTQPIISTTIGEAFFYGSGSRFPDLFVYD
jgi:hypothetical protein